jgi:hypothetical protein
MLMRMTDSEFMREMEEKRLERKGEGGATGNTAASSDAKKKGASAASEEGSVVVPHRPGKHVPVRITQFM